MLIVQLTPEDIRDIKSLATEIAERYTSVEDPAFLEGAPTYSQELPRSLRRRLNRFRLVEPSGVCLIRGYPVDQERIGRTPANWKAKPVPSPTIEQDLVFFLCSGLLGDPIGWATQQQGYILHDILPIKGHEAEQMGSGSEAPLLWHTEDAFHPYRTDYLGLMCLRNPDAVETTYASMEDVRLDEETARILREPHFTIRPDESHLAKNRSDLWCDVGASDDLLRRAYERIDRMNTQPERVAVLFGDPTAPYVRIDPFFMERPTDDSDAARALDTIVAAIDDKITGVALQPGDMLFLDNSRAVHGRKPFKARYDGTDRWLRRLNIARDLRKSRDSRPRPDCRIIF
jgi:Fe(II)/alpha-ketoglutarate-dependent arginine beta-hydroxylase